MPDWTVSVRSNQKGRQREAALDESLKKPTRLLGGVAANYSKSDHNRGTLEKTAVVTETFSSLNLMCLTVLIRNVKSAHILTYLPQNILI